MSTPTLVEALIQDAAVAPGGNDQVVKATTLAEAGDLIVAVAFQRATPGALGTSRSDLTFDAFTPLSGFSGGNGSLLVAGAWQPDSTQTDVIINGGTASVNNTLGLVVLVYRDVDPTVPLDVTGALTTFAAPSTPFDVTVPSMTTVTDDALAVAVWASFDDNQWAVQTGGWSEVADLESALGADISISVATKPMPTAGATGAVVNRQTSEAGDAGRYAYFALRPAPATGTDAPASAPGGTGAVPSDATGDVSVQITAVGGTGSVPGELQPLIQGDTSVNITGAPGGVGTVGEASAAFDWSAPVTAPGGVGAVPDADVTIGVSPMITAPAGVGTVGTASASATTAAYATAPAGVGTVGSPTMGTDEAVVVTGRVGRFLTLPCTVIRRVATGQNRYGHPQYSDQSRDALCYSRQLSTTEVLDVGLVLGATRLAILAPDETVGAGDAVRIDDITYEVIGDPERKWNPKRQRYEYLRVYLKRGEI